MAECKVINNYFDKLGSVISIVIYAHEQLLYILVANICADFVVL